MINIFAKPAFLNINPSEALKDRKKPIRAGHVMRVSSMIRGDQIADQIGANLNPASVGEDDISIYVKPMVRKGEDFKFEGKAYLDIIDGHNLGQLALKHPEIGIIVCSQADYDIMSKELPNKIYPIPQHHCNFERKKRNSTEIKRIGVIGELPAFNFIPKELEEELGKRGIELVKFSRFFTRQDIVDFYMSIDLQIVWRPYKKILSNPLKIVNASSFGIPTIALDEPAFKEVENCYVGVEYVEQFFSVLDGFRKGTLYQIYSQECIRISERYHIENIAKLYKELP